MQVALSQATSVFSQPVNVLRGHAIVLYLIVPTRHKTFSLLPLF